jgi:hypothetical protein
MSYTNLVRKHVQIFHYSTQQTSQVPLKMAEKPAVEIENSLLL